MYIQLKKTCYCSPAVHISINGLEDFTLNMRFCFATALVLIFLPLSHKRLRGYCCHCVRPAGGVYTQLCEHSNLRMR